MWKSPASQGLVS